MKRDTKVLVMLIVFVIVVASGIRELAAAVAPKEEPVEVWDGPGTWHAERFRDGDVSCYVAMRGTMVFGISCVR